MNVLVVQRLVEVGHASVLQCGSDIGFPPQTVIESESGGDAPAVLRVQPDVLMALGIVRHARLAEAGGRAEQEIRHGKVRDLAGEAEASRRRAEEGRVLDGANVIDSELDLVAAAQHAEVVGKLVALGRYRRREGLNTRAVESARDGDVEIARSGWRGNVDAQIFSGDVIDLGLVDRRPIEVEAERVDRGRVDHPGMAYRG